MAPRSSAAVSVALLMVAVAAVAVASPTTNGTAAIPDPPPPAANVVRRSPPATVPGPPRKARSCDPTIVLCVQTNTGYAPSFQEPRLYSVGARRLSYPVGGGAPLLPGYHLQSSAVTHILPPPVVPIHRAAVVPVHRAAVVPVHRAAVVPVHRAPVVPVLPAPAVPVLHSPAVPVLQQPAVRVIHSAVSVIPRPAVRVIPPPAVRVISPPAVRVIPPPAVPVISQPAVPVISHGVSVFRTPYQVVPRPYVTGTRLFPTYPATLPRAPARTDIRSFYQSAVLVGDGVVHQGGSTAELICDFTTNGPYPSSDILTDVVWQRLGADGVYLNTPMTSGSENVLYCPNDYVMPPPVNYGFSVVGTRTSLVIRGAGPRDYGTYRCYATRVNRLNPDDRHPVYMEIQFGASTPRNGLVG